MQTTDTCGPALLHLRYCHRGIAAESHAFSVHVLRTLAAADCAGTKTNRQADLLKGTYHFGVLKEHLIADQKLGRVDTLLAHTRYDCNCGPEDERVAADAAVPAAPAPGRRRKKTEHDCSIKVGHALSKALQLMGSARREAFSELHERELPARLGMCDWTKSGSCLKRSTTMTVVLHCKSARLFHIEISKP